MGPGPNSNEITYTKHVSNYSHVFPAYAAYAWPSSITVQTVIETKSSDRLPKIDSKGTAAAAEAKLTPIIIAVATFAFRVVFSKITPE